MAELKTKHPALKYMLQKLFEI